MNKASLILVTIIIIVISIVGFSVLNKPEVSKQSNQAPTDSSNPANNSNNTGQPPAPEMDRDIAKTNERNDKLTKILAGSTSTYTEFRQEDYDKALRENKVIFLDFYASWCPICRAEEPAIFDGFNSLTTDEIVGFRVNFKDPETDENEKRLAEQFRIPIQHTKVIIKNGQEVSRSSDSWELEDFRKAVDLALTN